MHLSTLLSTVLTTIALATAIPVSEPVANFNSSPLSPRGGSVCGTVYTGYNSPVWKSNSLFATNSCRELGMGIFLYSIEAGCHCRFYSKPGCTSGKTVDRNGPVNASYMNPPYESRWYVCNRI